MTPAEDDRTDLELRAAFAGLGRRFAAAVEPARVAELAARVAAGVQERTAVPVPVAAGADVPARGGDREGLAAATVIAPPDASTLEPLDQASIDTLAIGSGAAALPAPDTVAVLAAVVEHALDRLLAAPGGDASRAGIGDADPSARRHLARAVAVGLLGTDRLTVASARAFWPPVADAIRGRLSRPSDPAGVVVEPPPGVSGGPGGVNWAAVDERLQALSATDPGAAAAFALRTFVGLNWEDIAELTGRTRGDAVRAVARVEQHILTAGA